MRDEKSPYLGYGGRFVIIIAFFMVSVLIGLLFLEYRFFCIETQKMMALQAQYRLYVRDIQRKNEWVQDSLRNERGLVRGDTHSVRDSVRDGARDDEFIMVNRDREYLKDSMIDYFKDCDLENMLSQVDIDDWHDYTGYIKNNKKEIPDVRDIRRPSRLVRSVNCSSLSQKRDISSLYAYFFMWPIERDQFWLSSLFGPRKKDNGMWGKHMGIDMAAHKGTLVKAVADGIVGESRYDASGYGNMIVLLHNNRYKTRFAHLDKIFVKRGQQVSRGQIIGTVGSTGFVRKKGKDGSHLHFEVYSYNKHINPLTVLPVLM